MSVLLAGSLVFGIPTSAFAVDIKVPEIKVPMDIKIPKDISKLKPEEAYKKAYEDFYKEIFEEAYKKGFEDAVKEKDKDKDKDKDNQDTEKDKDKKNNDDGDIIGKALDCGEYEITIKEIKLEDKKLMITYDFKNTGDDSTSPWMAGVFTAYQDGVELDDISLDGDAVFTFTKNVKKGGTLKDLVRVFKADSDTKDFSFEIGSFFDFNNEKVEFEYTVK